MEKDLKAALEQVAVIRDSFELRLKKLERNNASLVTKLDQLGNMFDAVFAEVGDESEPSNIGTNAIEDVPTDAADFIRDEDGSLLVPGTYKTDLEKQGYKVIGTVSDDGNLLLKMRHEAVV